MCWKVMGYDTCIVGEVDQGDKVGLSTGKLWNMIHVSLERLTKGDKSRSFHRKVMEYDTCIVGQVDQGG